MDETRRNKTGETQPEREEVERAHGVEPKDSNDRGEAAADDFAAGSATMGNAFPGNAAPYAGALLGRTEDLVEPTSAEERSDADEPSGPPPAE